MSQLVHKASQLGGSLDTLPHASVPHTNIEKQSVFEEIILPTNSSSFGAGQVVTWYVPGSSAYTDLANSYVRISGQWSHVDNSQVQIGTAESAPIIGFPNNLFNNVNAYMNGSKVSPSRGGDLWINFVDRLMLNKVGVSENSLNNQVITGVANVFAVDNCQTLDFLDTFATSQYGPADATAAFTGTSNIGALVRANTILSTNDAATDIYQYQYVPCLGGWANNKKLVPDRVEIRLELTLSSGGSYIINNSALTNPVTAVPDDKAWKFTITAMDLVLKRCQLAQRVVEQNSLAMIQSPYLMPICIPMYQRNIVPASGSIDLSSIYQGSRPKLIAVGVSDARTLGGLNNSISQNGQNPFYMSQFTGIADAPLNAAGLITSAYVLINGKQYPQRSYDSVSRLGFTRQYKAFLDSMKLMNPDKSVGALINYPTYIYNYSWLFFPISTSDFAEEMYDLTEDVNAEFHCTGVLSATAPTNLVVHSICWVDSMIEVDGARSVRVLSKSGAVLKLDESEAF